MRKRRRRRKKERERKRRKRRTRRERRERREEVVVGMPCATALVFSGFLLGRKRRRPRECDRLGRCITEVGVTCGIVVGECMTGVCEGSRLLMDLVNGGDV